MASGLEGFDQVQLIADESSQHSEAWLRIQAWLDDDWAQLYNLTETESKLFSLPISKSSLHIELRTIPPQSELEFAMDLDLRPTDIVDIRPGTKPLSILMTAQALEAESSILYSDPRTCSLLNLKTGGTFDENTRSLSLMEHLFLAHQGPVIGLRIEPLVIDVDAPNFRQFEAVMRSNDKKITGQARTGFHELLRRELELEPPEKLSSDPSVGNKSDDMKLIKSIRQKFSAITMELFAARLCAGTLDCEWRMNVQFLDPTLNARKDRLEIAVQRRLHQDYHIECIRQKTKAIGIQKWNSQTPAPGYDPAHLFDEEVSGGFMHELDVIGYDKGQMYLISVKNRWIRSEADEHKRGLYQELDQLLLRHKHQLNAPVCHCILVSGMPITEELKAAADELGIHACFVLDLPALLRRLYSE